LLANGGAGAKEKHPITGALAILCSESIKVFCACLIHSNQPKSVRAMPLYCEKSLMRHAPIPSLCNKYLVSGVCYRAPLPRARARFIILVTRLFSLS
jgi:hypothetical protein